MAVAPNIVSGAGLHTVWALKLNATGTPAATSATVYEGFKIPSVGLEMTVPDYSVLNFNGDDRTIGQMVLPPAEGVTATLTTEQHNQTLAEALTGLTVETVGASSEISWQAGIIGSSDTGNENNFCVVINQQSVDTGIGSATAGQTFYRWFVFPNCKILEQPGSYNFQGKYTATYRIVPATVSKAPWGQTLGGTVGVATYAQYLQGTSKYKVKVVSFLGDNATTALLFNTSYPAAAGTDAVITVFENGTEVVAGITKATTGVTYAVAPATNDDIVVIYGSTKG
jgi:hypothetical protein